MDGKTLAEKQMWYYNAHKCIYCNQPTDLIDSIEVYQESHGLIYRCTTCLAHVGVHKGGDQAMGTVAKKELRDLRHEAHKWFDPLWESKCSRSQIKRNSARRKAYAWVAEFLKIDPVESHIGYFNIEQCKALIEECKKYYLTPEQKEEKRIRIKLRIDIVNFQSGFMGFEVRHFQVGALNKMELFHPISGKIYDYFPETNSGYWQGKKNKLVPVEDIEKFIEEHFKQKLK